MESRWKRRSIAMWKRALGFFLPEMGFVGERRIEGDRQDFDGGEVLEVAEEAG